MIRVVRLDGKPIVLNGEQIQSVENTPDTLITMTNGTKWIVQQPVDEVVRLFMEYKRNLEPDKFVRKA